MKRIHLAGLVAVLAVLTTLVVFPAASFGTGTPPTPSRGRSSTKAARTVGGPRRTPGRSGRRRSLRHGRPDPAPAQFDPFASILWNDVWRSRDSGVSWRRLGTAPWAPRAYFQAVTKDGVMYVLGGQDQASGQPSTFYNDVWASRDGRSWTRVVEHAPWQARAGLSANVSKGWIYVLGGSNGDDVAIGGSGRTLFNDVWRSRDGRAWQQVTAGAQWTPRAGAAVV